MLMDNFIRRLEDIGRLYRLTPCLAGEPLAIPNLVDPIVMADGQRPQV